MDSGTPGSLPVVWLAAAEIGLFGVVHNCRNFFFAIQNCSEL